MIDPPKIRTQLFLGPDDNNTDYDERNNHAFGAGRGVCDAAVMLGHFGALAKDALPSLTRFRETPAIQDIVDVDWSIAAIKGAEAPPSNEELAKHLSDRKGPKNQWTPQVALLQDFREHLIAVL